MLTVNIIQEAPNLILALEGALDLVTASVLRKRVDTLELNKIDSLTFALDGLEFIDSTGIGQLIGYYRYLATHNIPVYLANNNAEIEEILQLIGVREIMELT